VEATKKRKLPGEARIFQLWEARKSREGSRGGERGRGHFVLTESDLGALASGDPSEVADPRLFRTGDIGRGGRRHTGEAASDTNPPGTSQAAAESGPSSRLDALGRRGARGAVGVDAWDNRPAARPVRSAHPTMVGPAHGPAGAI
jgi:hypothetical protein